MAREKQTKLDSRAVEDAADDEISDAEYEAGVEALEQINRQRIAEFKERLRAEKINWPDDELRWFLQELRPLLVRAVFRNAPLPGANATPADAESTVLDVAAALARHVQRSVTRRETARDDHADIRAALRAYAAKRGGKPVRGDMKRIYPDVARAINKERRKKGRNEVSWRTVQRVWLETKS